MKGLLLKDWYMVQKYFKMYLFIAVVFLAMSLIDTGNLFFVFYPCLLCGMLPVSLLGYDERSHWLQYSSTLPYRKSQIVSAKYLIGLFAQIAMLLVTGIAQGVKMVISGTFVLNDFIVLLLLLLIVATFTSSISLPFIFKLGVEKGRMAYYVMIGFASAATAISSSWLSDRLQTDIQPNLLLALLALGGIGVYALSWYLSIVFFKKREL